ncbi:hypothetical protein O6H91_17G064200 [Diphasiastrum complanatum]|uniref:Uncharacterized protein n=1 Tax=Diphasiastrum complanatum TaxID=34168 RepID=A0ACC2B8K4_DIPCM|nr:hypothetical protein O6H91_17G064200 [Diphasiastrum complanatum]
MYKILLSSADCKTEIFEKPFFFSFHQILFQHEVHSGIVNPFAFQFHNVFLGCRFKNVQNMNLYKENIPLKSHLPSWNKLIKKVIYFACSSQDSHIEHVIFYILFCNVWN